MYKPFGSSVVPLSVCLLAVVGQAHAEAAKDWVVWNVGVVNDFRFRGISQTRLGPALQGGVDVGDAHGWYAGVWASTIRWLQDAGATSGPVEVDAYLGHRWQVDNSSYDVGLVRYDYVGHQVRRQGQYVDPSTTEVYGAYNVENTAFKYSHALTRWMGNPNSQNSGYIEVSQTFPLSQGWTLLPHIGHLRVRNTEPRASYTDYAVTVSRPLGQGLTFSGSLQSTNANRSVYQTADGRFTGGTGLVVGLKYVR